ncbi:MAG: hypothetical protein ABIH52_04020 [Candidatus Aenigmatarchaeota archaeon]|nr:hypothetical protein [Nanoarchaeota archaeon]
MIASKEFWEEVEEFYKTQGKVIAYAEDCICNWFEKNYKQLGFEKILRRQWNKTPDYIVLKNGKEVKVEIEYLASSFIQHKHKISEADIVICCKNDVELKGVKVIALDDVFVCANDIIEKLEEIRRKRIEAETQNFIERVWKNIGVKK